MKEKLLKKFCSDQVCILLERMDSHPEEFVNPHGKSRFYEPRWASLLNDGAFGLIEKRLLKRKLFALRQKQTQADILSVLMQNATDADDEGPRMSTAGRFSDRLQQKMILNRAQIDALMNPNVPQGNKNP